MAEEIIIINKTETKNNEQLERKKKIEPLGWLEHMVTLISSW
jgi:hypothetical protein